MKLKNKRIYYAKHYKKALKKLPISYDTWMFEEDKKIYERLNNNRFK